ncbi:MAG: hypothetical protein ACFWTN_00280 [Clostridium sp.]|jgi:hypothetical protein
MLFIRGSITIGSLYMDNRIGYIFGSGLITAYSLENNIAIYPRIIIDEPVLKLVKARLNYYIMKDYDEKYFLDYLSHFSYLFFDRQWDEQYSPFLIREIYAHREALLQAIKVFTDKKLLPKYKWVARYHNAFCGKNHIEKLEHLWIKKTEFDWAW